MVRGLAATLGGIGEILMVARSICPAVLVAALFAPFQGPLWAASPDSLVQKNMLDPYPLRPADTSSPRDTLRTFLTNSNLGIKLWMSGVNLRELARRRSRTVATLDYSQVVDNHLTLVRAKHVLLLKEVLDRIPVPPDEEIPDDGMVAEQGIKQWTIPDTVITIARVQEGPHARAFLFSADTVRDIEEIYYQSKHLPYQPGATEGVYEKFLAAEGLSEAAVSELRNRLKPVDTSSPRSTYLGFWENLNRAYRLIMEADAALTAEPPTMSQEEARAVERDIDIHLQRAMSTLDLSGVPKVIRDDVGVEVVLQLKEVLDRVRQPYLDAIPDAEVVRDWKRANKDVLLITPQPFSYQFPNTKIEIVEVLEGLRTGEFLFSAHTVSRAETYYKTILDIPYRPGATEGFYRFFSSNPGYLMPAAYPLTRWVNQLPAVFMREYADQTLWQWLGLVLSVVAIFLVIRLVSRVIRSVSKQLSELVQGWLKLLAPITVALTLLVIHEFINHGLNITGTVLSIVTQTFETIVYLMLAWFVYALLRALSETLIALPRIPEKGLDASLLRLGARVLSIISATWIIVSGIQKLGIDMLPMLAGVGVGGLAVALAARSTLENFMGTLNLYADRPVRVGDFCRYGADFSPDWVRIGTIEEIGLRSTRIRGIDRTITTIPNADFCNMHVVNLTKRDERLLKAVLQLRYETTPEQMRYILTKLRELLLGHPMVTPDPARVRFIGYGSFSMDVEIFAYLRCQGENEFLAIQEDILLRMGDIVKEGGSGFAFPSQTAYLTRDTGLDAERRDEAESQVEFWRGRGKLPFPEFEDEERERLEGILDYPPKGSPDYSPRTSPSAPKPGKQALD